MNYQELLEIIIKKPELDEYSFSGNCFSMAYALNKILPESKIVISYNKRIFKETKNYIGHCGIKIENIIIDGEGIINEEDFLSWGMLDESDLSYIENTPISAEEWKKDSYISEIVEVSPEELESRINLDVVNLILEIISNERKFDYSRLADILSDHLYMANSLDIDFLKTFSEFSYSGEAYRLLVLKKNQRIKSFKNQSFSKDINGIKEFIYNYCENDETSYETGNKKLFKANIVGFDVQKALKFLYENKFGITKKSYLSWKDENEVIAFEINDLKEINLDLTKE